MKWAVLRYIVHFGLKLTRIEEHYEKKNVFENTAAEMS